MQPLLPLLLVVTVAAGPAGFVRRHPKKPEIDLGIEAQARAYEKACAAGEMASCVGLAGMYYFGYGVPADRSEAERLYRLGCDAGQAQGCLDLGTMYHNGDGGSAGGNPQRPAPGEGAAAPNGVRCGGRPPLPQPRDGLRVRQRREGGLASRGLLL
jgi:hypothetical protein